MSFTILIIIFFIICLIAYILNKVAKNARDNTGNDLTSFLNNCNGQIIVFDVETNGLDSDKNSVLSFSAIKYSLASDFTLNEMVRFERYYYPVESFHRQATDINGLTRKHIGELRKDVTYAQHFNDDYDLVEFANSANSYVAHNISFDQSFAKSLPLSKANCFCTMKTNADIVKARWMESKGEWKWPSLAETARFYEIDFSHKTAHGSTYDAEITAKILQKMIFNLKGIPVRPELQEKLPDKIELTFPTEY